MFTCIKLKTSQDKILDVSNELGQGQQKTGKIVQRSLNTCLEHHTGKYDRMKDVTSWAQEHFTDRWTHSVSLSIPTLLDSFLILWWFTSQLWLKIFQNLKKGYRLKRLTPYFNNTFSKPVKKGKTIYTINMFLSCRSVNIFGITKSHNVPSVRLYIHGTLAFM